MKQENLLRAARLLSAQGMSIRAVAAELGVNRGRVERALRSQGSPVTDRGVADVFVGRGPEMSRLNSAIHDAIAGRGRMIVLVGEPGIGKTRTAEEAAENARACGAQVYWGRCSEDDGAPPYWPVRQVIEGYARSTSTDKLRQVLGFHAPELVGVAPLISNRIPGILAAEIVDDPNSARFRLFDAITSFFRNAAEQRPLVIILDNLHWADRSTLRLLEFLVPNLVTAPLTVIGTYRDTDLSKEHPLMRTFGELAAHSHFEQVSLRGFSKQEVASYISAMVERPPIDELVSMVHTRTAGNPHYVVEFVHLIGQDNEPSGSGPVADIQLLSSILPDGVKQSAARRIDRLSECCQRLLTLASVVGNEFSADVIEKLAFGVTGEELLDALDEAVQAKLLIEFPNSSGRHYRFSHALIRQALYDGMPAGHRGALHALIARELENMYGETAEAHAPELAHHLGAATIAGCTLGKLVKYNTLAGEQALNAFAYEEALAYFTRALKAKRGQPMDDQTAEILFGLGRTHASLSERKEALVNLKSAFEYYHGIGETERALEVASAAFTDSDPEVTELLTRALALTPSGCIEAARIQSVLGINHLDEEPLTQALKAARNHADVSLETWTLSRKGVVDWHYLRHREALENQRQALCLYLRAGDPYAEVQAHHWAAMSLIALGEPSEVEQHAQTCLELAERTRAVHRMTQGLSVNLVLARSNGDWAREQELGERHVGLAIPGERSVELANQALCAYELGDQAQGEHLFKSASDQVRDLSLRRELDDMSLLGVGITAVRIAVLTGADEHVEFARQAVKALQWFRWSPYASCIVNMVLGYAAVLVRDTEEAQVRYDRLNSLLCPSSETIPHRRPGSVQGRLTPVERVLGLLAGLTGDMNRAGVHFDRAIGFLRQAGYKPELAWTLYDYSELLNKRDGSGDAPKAAASVEEGLGIAVELEMKPLTARLRAMQQELSLNQSRHKVLHPDDLTPRELDVLRLVAQGKTNQETSEALGISPNTVSRHLSNIFAKTQATNRTGAVAFAARNGLL